MYSVAFSPDGTRVVSGSYAGILLWDAAANWIDHVPPSVVNSVAFSHDGTRVVSGSQTDLVNIWNADTGDLGLVLKGHSKWVLSVAFSRDGTDKELAATVCPPTPQHDPVADEAFQQEMGIKPINAPATSSEPVF